MAFSFFDYINSLKNNKGPVRPGYDPLLSVKSDPLVTMLNNRAATNPNAYGPTGVQGAVTPHQTGTGVVAPKVTIPKLTTGSYRSGGGISVPALPDTSGLQNDVRNRISSIQQAYDALSGNVDQIVNERAGQYGQNYDQQTSDLNKAYGTNAAQQNLAYGARGLGSSSYLQNAQQDAADIYNTNVKNIETDRANTLGQLGQFAASNKAQYAAGRNQYGDVLNNLSKYDMPTIQNLYEQLGGTLGNVQAQQAGLGTNASFIDKLNAITPVKNTGTSQLASKLQQIVTSSAPNFAKSQIAQGLIKQAQLTDPNAQSYWSNYFNQLLTGA